jgi:MYXO-CTERM domain-containing protein
VSCAVDSDCPKTWTCTVVGASGSGCAGAARVLPDGGIQQITPVCDPPPPTTETRECRPPNYYYPGSFAGKGEDAQSTSGGTVGATGRGNEGSAIPPGAPLPGAGTGVGGSTAHSDSNNAAAPSSSDNDGCQMSAGHGATGSAALLGLLGLAGIARRRRTRWG